MAIAAIQQDSAFYTLQGTITGVQEEGFGRSKRLRAVLKDESGYLDLVWFRGLAYLSKMLSPGQRYYVYGQVSRFRSRYSMVHPELIAPHKYEKALDHYQGIQPEYPSNQYFT
ncbi:OB-fold nucleic acid binding domain-containing protein, partial [Arthrospira platensis SPKY1]|nr:OB-fold nucleic acid binding domain-containing protein [Arthrospira platensis SPKY1]